jgi:hypothetical protein
MACCQLKGWRLGAIESLGISILIGSAVGFPAVQKGAEAQITGALDPHPSTDIALLSLGVRGAPAAV